MPKWTEYTSKDTLADNDEVMLYDATGKANKRGLMSKFWDYVVDKMATAVISKLETNNKTIIGAINALYGNSYSLSYGKEISSGQDLDNYLTPGNYVCKSATIAETLSNCPTPYSFSLKVEISDGSPNWYRHILYDARHPNIYVRVYKGAAGWQKWGLIKGAEI